MTTYAAKLPEEALDQGARNDLHGARRRVAEDEAAVRQRGDAQRYGPVLRTPSPRRPAVSLEEEEAAVLRVGGENAAVSKDGQVGLRQDIPAPPADGELRGVPLPEALDAAVPGVGPVEAGGAGGGRG